MKPTGILSIFFLAATACLSAVADPTQGTSNADSVLHLTPSATPSPRPNRPTRSNARRPALPSTNAIPEKEDEVIVSSAVDTSNAKPAPTPSSGKKRRSRSTSKTPAKPDTAETVPVPEGASVESSARPNNEAAISPVPPPGILKAQDIEVENDETHRRPRAVAAPGYIGETEKNVNSNSGAGVISPVPVANAKGTDVAMEELNLKRPSKPASPAVPTNRMRKPTRKP